MCRPALEASRRVMFARSVFVVALAFAAAPALAQNQEPPAQAPIQSQATAQSLSLPGPIQSSVHAQGSQVASQSAPAQVRPSEPAIPVTAGWQDGFFIQSAN